VTQKGSFMARLIVKPNSPDSRELELKPGNNLIGRGFANDFKIEDPSVSSSHCQITVSDGSITIKDLGSTNGTFVNRAPIQEAILQAGHVVHLGGVEMAFYSDASAAPPPIPAPAILSPSSIALAPARPAYSISIARAVEPEPTLSELESPPPVIPTAPVTSTGSQQCKFHPRTAGRYFCQKCHIAFCELCVTARAVSGVQRKFCRKCGNECAALHVEAIRPQAEKGFFARVPGAFIFPVRGSGVLVLLVATVLFAALDFMAGPSRGFIPRGIGFGRVMQIFALGYFFSFMQTIIHSTAVGDDEMPPLPSMANMWEDVLLPCLQLLGLTLICFGPAIAMAVFTVSSEDSSMGVPLIALGVLGGLYFPMAFLSVAMLDSVAAANPLQVIPSIFKVPLEYVTTLFLLAVVLGIRASGTIVLPYLFPRGLSTHSIPKLFAFFGASAFWGIASLYLLIVAMRILGLLYFTRREKLGWLSR
jgi:hypothetical protein